MSSAEAETNQVADGIIVSLNYQLRLDDGVIIDETGTGEPLEFLQGSGSIVRGLESNLYGMSVGQEKDIRVAPEDGYGDYDPNEKISLPRSSFPSDMQFEEGMGLQMRDSQSGEVVIAYVEGLQPDTVELDLNHPLAGESLFFHIEITGLRPATSEELEHGHAHGAGHVH